MTASTFDRVKEFNIKAGKKLSPIGSVEYWTAIENQYQRIIEELQETYRAIKERDLVKMLDGGCDLDVTVSGYNYLTGASYKDAIKAVLDNNDLKTTTDKDLIAKTLEELYNNDEYHVHNEEQEGVVYYTILRNSDNKIMKLLDHPEVGLTGLVPQLEQIQFFLTTDPYAVDERLIQFLVNSGINVVELANIKEADRTPYEELINQFGNDVVVSAEVGTGSVLGVWSSGELLEMLE